MSRIDTDWSLVDADGSRVEADWSRVQQDRSRVRADWLPAQRERSRVRVDRILVRRERSRVGFDGFRLAGNTAGLAQTGVPALPEGNLQQPVMLRHEPIIPRRIAQQVRPVHRVLKDVVEAAIVYQVQMCSTAILRLSLPFDTWSQGW